MNRKLYEIGSVLFLIAAWTYAAVGVKRGVPAAWLLFIAPSVVYGVITISQRLPITSLNLTVKVTPENASRVEPVVRDFFPSLKAFTMMLVYWVNAFAVSSIQPLLFILIEAALLVAIFAHVFRFLGTIKKLA